MKVKTDKKLHIFNNVLSLVVIGFFAYVLAYPLLPGWSFWARTKLHKNPPLVSAVEKGTDKPTDENMIVIPRLLMQEKINESKNTSALKYGIWRRPNTSTPDKQSNTVMVGHRFTYDGAAVFYNLDKVKVDDEIVVYWNKKKYVYTVERIKEVPPTAIEVEDSTADARLTLYTCTPIWSAKNRLVVQAKLTEKPR